MEKEYYIVVNDKRVGPLKFDQLRDYFIQPSTLVWTAGMADWARAGSIPELESVISAPSVDGESAFGSYAQPEQPPRHQQWNSQNSAYSNRYSQQNQNYGNNTGSNGQYHIDTNWKTLAIVALVAGFLLSCIGGIVGIFALIEANKAQKAESFSDEFGARNHWSNCKTLTIISFVLSGIGLVTSVVMFAKGASAMSLLYSM